MFQASVSRISAAHLCRAASAHLGLAAALTLSALPAQSQLTQSQAMAAVISEVILPSPNLPSLVAYSLPTLLAAGDVVEPAHHFVQPFPGSPRILSGDTWFFWIDDGAAAHFVHPTRFVYVNATDLSPVVGSGIAVETEGWWPVVNGVAHYSDSLERHNSPDKFFGDPPDGPVFPPPPAGPPPQVRPGQPPSADTGKKCAILVSGAPGREFQGDLDDMEDAVKSAGGVAAGDVQKKLNATKADLDAMIKAANDANCRKVFVHIGSHGGKNKIQFKDKVYTAEELAACLKKIKAAEVCITLEACQAGSLLDEIKAALTGKTGVTTSATDADKPSCAWVKKDGSDGNSYYIEDFVKCWKDPAADGTNAGTDVSQAEAFAWVKANGKQKTKDQKPDSVTHGLPDDTPVIGIHELNFPVSAGGAAIGVQLTVTAQALGHLGVAAVTIEPPLPFGLPVLGGMVNLNPLDPLFNSSLGFFGIQPMPIPVPLGDASIYQSHLVQVPPTASGLTLYFQGYNVDFVQGMLFESEVLPWILE